jgi:beta-lactamase regulating signal transducer with metallopeptidase domain
MPAVNAISPAPAITLAANAPKKSSPWNWATIERILAIGYFAVVALLLLRTLSGLAIALRVLRNAEQLPEDALAMIPADGATIRLSRVLSTPVTIGSTVILPAGFDQWSPMKLRVVMAHELSHVRQRDFYLQLLAAFHGAVFWFSPLGWWLPRKLSDLGEALSDRAGLEQAQNPASYAQILLEFAAMPRTTPHAGVAMARSSNLSNRIERILNARNSGLAYLGSRRHAVLAAVLVPAALLATVACIRIVPSVEAANRQSSSPISGQVTGNVAGQVTGQVDGTVSGQVTGNITGDATEPPAPAGPGKPAEPALAPTAPVPPPPAEEAEQIPDPPDPPAAFERNSHDLDGDAFAFVHENPDGTLRWKGEYNDNLAKARKKLNLHGDYLWFEHDGKSYIITDPVFLAQSRVMFKGDEALERAQANLNMQMEEMQKKMEKITPEIVKAQIETPEFKAKMANLDAELASLQSEKFKKLVEDQAGKSQKLADQIAQEKLAELEGHIGDIQGKIGELQGLLGEKQGEWGEKQGLLGEKMGELGEQMGKLGEQQGRQAEEAGRKLKSLLDQAVKDGKAKPVE